MTTDAACSSGVVRGGAWAFLCLALHRLNLSVHLFAVYTGMRAARLRLRVGAG